MKLPIVLFDLGDVLVHIHYRNFIQALALDHSVDEEDLLRLLTPEGRLYESGKMTSEEFFRRISEELSIAYNRSRLERAWNTILAGEIEGMRKLVEAVSRQTEIYLLSNTNEVHFTFARENFPILDFFDDYFVSYKIGAMKPSHEIYEHVVRSLGGLPDRLLFVDNSDKNVSGAVQVGIRGVVFTGAEEVGVRLRDEGFEI